MATQIEGARLLCFKAAWLKDQHLNYDMASAMAKLYATEAAQSVIDKAVQVMGGLGVRVGNPVERLYREIRAMRIYEGASEVQKVVIARQMAGDHAKSA